MVTTQVLQLHRQLVRTENALEAARAENRRLKAALAFYADRGMHIDPDGSGSPVARDCGERARRAFRGEAF